MYVCFITLGNQQRLVYVWIGLGSVLFGWIKFRSVADALSFGSNRPEAEVWVHLTTQSIRVEKCRLHSSKSVFQHNCTIIVPHSVVTQCKYSKYSKYSKYIHCKMIGCIFLINSRREFQHSLEFIRLCS